MSVIIDMHPVGWDGLTVRQWKAVRDMIKIVKKVAMSSNLALYNRADNFLIDTEGYDE